MRIIMSMLVLSLICTLHLSAFAAEEVPAQPALQPLGRTLVSDNKKDKNTRKLGVFTIGRETTFFTEPLDKEGYVDFAAAINKKLSQGVTPANNACVLLWRAHGPRPTGAGMPAEFFQWLGIDEPPVQGDYFIDYFRFVKEHLKRKIKPGEENKVFDELDAVGQRPWTAKEHADVAAWLKANEKPLALVVEASKRSRYFSPLIPPRNEQGISGGLIVAQLPGVQKTAPLPRHWFAGPCRALVRGTPMEPGRTCSLAIAWAGCWAAAAR